MSETDASKEDGNKDGEEESSGDNNNDDDKEVFTNGSDPEEVEVEQLRSTPGQHQAKGRAYLEKVNERKRTWDYFEINHPKAISDKKLEQLKEKYTRRKTEASLLLEKKKEEREVSGRKPTLSSFVAFFSTKSTRYQKTFQKVGKSEREGQSEKEGLKNGRKALATTRYGDC